MSTAAHVVILANPADDRVLVGVKLVERVRRASVLAGVSPDRVHVVTNRDELSAVQSRIDGCVVVVRGTTQVVMTSFMDKLANGRGTAIAWDTARNCYADALRVEGDLAPLWRALASSDSSETGDARFADGIADKIAMADVDRHPARTREEHAIASKWIYQFVNKPLLDAPVTKYFYRPIARPFTKLFTRLPFTPNHITIASIIIGQIGCVIAARPGYWDHVLGIFTTAFISGILDNVDGELARLRLQASKLGAALDGVGDDLLRMSLLVALGVHVAPQFPDYPIVWLGIAGAVFTAAAMAPMYWYCVTVLKTWNIQNYNSVMQPDGDGQQSMLVKIGAQVGRRDFVDVATFALALANFQILAVVLFAIGSFVGFLTVIPAHLRVVRERRA
jgi:phosphatidylglycerophosphate synthase